MDKELKQAIKIAKHAQLDVFPDYEFGATLQQYAKTWEWSAFYAEEDNFEGYHKVREGDIVVEANGRMGSEDEDDDEDEFDVCFQFVFPQGKNSMYLSYGEFNGEAVPKMDEFFDTLSPFFEDDDDDDDEEDDDDDDDDDDNDDDNDEEDDNDDDDDNDDRPARSPREMRISDRERMNDSFDRPDRD